MASASNDFDLDAFLELQSSDEDEGDAPVLDRTLEEILNDSDDESSSDSSSKTSSLLFKNPNFTQKQQNNQENEIGAEETTEEGRDGFGSCFLEKIRRETGTSYEDPASILNVDNELGKTLEEKDRETEIPDSGLPQVAKLTELRSGLSLKKSAFSELGSKPSPFTPPTLSSSLLSLYPKLGSVKPNPKPGAALAAAAAASRAVLGPHAAALKNRMTNALHSQKSQDSEDLVDSIKEIAEYVEKEEEKEREDNESVSDGGVSGVFPLHENSNYSELNLVRSDEEMDRRRNVITDTDEESLPLSEHEEFVIQDEKPRAETVEDKIMSENDKDESTGQCKTDREVEAHDSNVQAIEYEQSSPTANSVIDTSLDTQSPKSSGTLIMPLTNSGIEASPGTQTLKSGATFLDDDDDHVSDVNTEENTNANNLFIEPSIEQMKDKVVEKVSEHKMAKTGDEYVEKVVKAENSRAARKISKKASASLKPLDLAEELEKRDASSGLHWEEGVAAQPMRLEGIRRGPPAIGHLQIDSTSSLSQALASQIYKRDHGSPQAIAVHLNYIAVGMSKGSVLVNASKYSAQNPDIMDSKAFILGSPVEKSQPPVTSMCFNQQGDFLLVGYGNGSLTLWELQRATVAKVVTGEHSSPIVHTLFLGQDLQNARQFKAITGDSKGIVLLHTFAVVPLLRRFSVTTQCLFDGQRTGTVLSMSALLVDESQMSASNVGQSSPSLAPGSLGSMMGGVVGGVVGGDAGKKLFSDGPSSEESGGVVIFVTQQTALVVRLTPSVEVYAKLSRPDGIREGAMPYTAWRRISNQHGSSGRKSNSNNTSNGSAADSETYGLLTMQEGSVSKGFHDTEEINDKASLLAVAWDRKVQVAQLLKSELKVLREWNLDSAALGVAWLDEQILVILNSKGQLCLFTKEGMELDRNRLPIEGGGLDSAVIYHTYFVNSFGNPEKTYHNSIAVRGAAIYLLGPMQLFRSRLLPWKERIQALQNAGDWMGALLMAMELYDGNAQGVIGLPRSLDAMREAIMPFLLQLLSAYVDEAFSYISLAFSNQHGKLETTFEGKTATGSIYPQIKEQFARVGGVAIEFCVHIKKTDVLFDSVFSKFVGAQHGGIFLELLEPYILKDMLGGLPPEVMHALVEHYSRKGWLQRIEQCVLHMDIASLDFNQVVRLCREHGLYSALIYLFNRGLDDFKAPLEELLVVAQDQKRPNSQAFGYKMLVYLKYCFLGLAFPPGHGNLPPERLAPLRTELLQFLLERTSIGRSQFKLSSEFLSKPYPNLCYLLWLDTEATLEVFRCAFVEDEYLHMKESDIPSLYLHGSDSENQKLKQSFHEIPSNVMDSENGCNLLQTLINALTEILDMSFSGTVRVPNAERHNNKGYDKFWPSGKEIGSLLEFIAYFVACRHATVSSGMLTHIIEYLASKTDFSVRDSPDNSNEDSSRRREKLMFALLKGVPEAEWDPLYALELAQNAQFHQVCSLVYMLKGQYVAALDSYIKDVGEPMYAFAFISNMLKQLADVNASKFAEFRSAVLKRIPDLIQLSREATFLLVLEHFEEENQQIISELRPHPKCLFLYLKTIIDVHSHGIPKYPSMPLESNSKISVLTMKGLDQSKELQDYLNRISNIPAYIQRHGIEVTDDMAELYLELLCQFEPKSVLKFLETFENYRLEHCLRLCQNYGVTDAAAFLLERVGDVASALSLIISDVNTRIQDMDGAVASMYDGDDKQLNALLMMPQVDRVHAILVAAVGLCQRNTLRLDPQESESLWFRLLDTFSEPTRDLYKHEKSLVVDKESHKKSQKEELTLKPLLRWKVINVGKAAFLRRIFAHFIGEIIEGMMGYVPLPTIMNKLLSDNGNQEFGDFKATILGLLGIYGYERTILDTAKNLIEDDAYYNISILKKGASHAYAPASSYCCICGRALDKESFGSSIYIFHCGHAAHLQCETQDTLASSKDSIRGCPACLPNKRHSVKKKKIETRKEIVREASSSVQNQSGSSKPMHENAMMERPYGLHYQSRFELLNNLQKGQKPLEVGLFPNLRLAPPTVYHEHKAHNSSLNIKEETSNGETSNGKLKKSPVVRAHRPKSSLPFQFPLTSSFFGNEKNKKR